MDEDTDTNVVPDDLSKTHQIQYKKKKRPVLICLIAFFLICVLVAGFVGVSYISRYNQATSCLKNIDAFIMANNYSQAFYDLQKFKSDYSFGDFPAKADERLKDLEDKSVQAYNEGIKVLSTDDLTYYENTQAYFEDYKKNYPYSKLLLNVNSLLDLISDYNDKATKFDEAIKLKDFIKANGDLVAVLDKYIQEAKNVHNMADAVMNQKDDSQLMPLLNLWTGKKDYYYNICDDINKAQSQDIEFTLFSSDEYEQIKTFINVSFIPAEALYNSIVNATDISNPDIVQETWGKYVELEPQVDEIITVKKNLFNASLNGLQSLQTEVENLVKQIQDFTEDTPGKTGL